MLSCFVAFLFTGCLGESTLRGATWPDDAEVVDASTMDASTFEVGVLDAAIVLDVPDGSINCDLGGECPQGQVCRESVCVPEPDAAVLGHDCLRSDQCTAAEHCFYGNCIPGVLRVKPGHFIIGVVSEEVDAYGLPLGTEVNYGEELHFMQSHAIKFRVMKPDGTYLVASAYPDDQGRNCGQEGAINMLPIDRFVFLGHRVPENFNINLECLGLGPPSAMYWTLHQ